MKKQFTNCFLEAKKSKEQTGPALIKVLKTRLDSMTCRMGPTSSIHQARQAVTYGHILVSSKEVDIPSYRLSVGDKVALTSKGRRVGLFGNNYRTNSVTPHPYISKGKDLKAAFSTEINREDIPAEIEDQLITEFYSKDI